MMFERMSFGDNDQVLVAKQVSKFRVKRIALEPHQVPYYYGLTALTSDAESGAEEETAPNTTCSPSKRRSFSRRSVPISKSTVAVDSPAGDSASLVPSFRCSMSNSVFQSSYDESTELDEGLADLTKATQTDEKTENFPLVTDATNQLLRFREFQSNELESKNGDRLIKLNNELIAKQETRSTQPDIQQLPRLSSLQQTRQSAGSEVAPSFRCSLSAAAFQSHCEDSEDGNTVFEQLQHARQVYSLKNRKSQANHVSAQQMSSRSDPSLGCSLAASAFQSTVFESTVNDCTTRSTFGEGEAQQIDQREERENRGRSSTTTIPSFKASFPASAFQSTYYESVANDQEDGLDCLPSSQDTYPSSSQLPEKPTKRPSSFHCSLAKSPFQSIYLEEDKLPNSQGTNFSPPKFRSSLAGASVFQSTYYESTVGEEDLWKQMDQTEPASLVIVEKEKELESAPSSLPLPVQVPAARKSTVLHPVMPKEVISFNKHARPSALQALVSQLGSQQQPINFGVFEKQSKRLSVDKAVQYSPQDTILVKDTSFRERVIEEESGNISEDYNSEIESPDKTLSATEEVQTTPQPCLVDKQLAEKIASLSLPAEEADHNPKYSKENEQEAEAPKTPSPDLPLPLKSALKKRAHTIELSRASQALREICHNYNTPTANLNRRKSVLFADKTSSQSPINTTESTVDHCLALESTVDHCLAVESTRLSNIHLGDLSKISRGSLRQGESLLEDETFNEQQTEKEANTVPHFADSSLWDAGGDDYEDEEEEEVFAVMGRTREWPSVVDNSLGLEDGWDSSPISSGADLSSVSANKTFDICYTPMAVSHETNNDSCSASPASLASPAVKRIKGRFIIRAPTKKPSPALVLPKPKIMHNNMNSPSVTELGLRRSSRNRLPRLNQALGQHPIYERDAEGNETLVGANDVVIKDKLLKKHKVADPLLADERDRELKNRRRLQHEKKEELRKRRFH